jgi:hypothetical protein
VKAEAATAIRAGMDADISGLISSTDQCMS